VQSMARGIGSSIAGRGRKERLNRAPEGASWIWFTRELLESDAWRTALLHVRRVVDRVCIEHMAHAGTENGNLAVTWSDFEKAGVRHKSLKLAIAEACQRGLIIVTVKGRASVGQDRWPARYALTWLPLKDGTPPSNRWKNYRSLPGNIESRGQTAPRENGGNPSSPRGQNAPRELAETNNSPGGKTPLGKMNFEQPNEQEHAHMNGNGNDLDHASMDPREKLLDDLSRAERLHIAVINAEREGKVWSPNSAEVKQKMDRIKAELRALCEEADRASGANDSEARDEI
jgi:hypothetical protein